MARRRGQSALARSMGSVVSAMTRSTLRSGRRVLRRALDSATERMRAPPGDGDWIAGQALGPGGVRRFHLFRPRGIRRGEKRPLLVMLHGCGQDDRGFALSTRMNRVAAREGFLVLYPQQERSANAQGCWNWFGIRSRRAQGEMSCLMAAIDQVSLFHPVDPARIALAGLSAGASMAALLATRHPARFRAVVMHSGVAPGCADAASDALAAMRGQRTPAAPEPGPPWPPLLVIHGSRDRVVWPECGRAAAQLWADQAGARAGSATRVQRGARLPMAMTRYRKGRRTVSMLCEIEGLAHAWSGGDARQPHGDASGPDASRMVWAFVRRQFEAD
ncbi:MAG: prolyl oligopeptidase family serine peptidase [Methyloversatilis sp.]|nr:prolyl oligopeptidase family serine peptidase [Methyloversatilis sp.]